MKKMYYSIGEVSEIVNEEKHVLRYWENEFQNLHPKKNSAGNRSYTESDIKAIVLIQSLLREQRLSLRDAKSKLLDYSIDDINVDDLLMEYGQDSNETLSLFDQQPIKVDNTQEVLQLLREVSDYLREA
ncbi:MAG: hypothetical protein B7C24_14365 [Bacteroidetes bacterium 4572_77]|nr:MAG: hypothetical protein B7C24_14365 [Bacteroidetes bacterium 4572_77]